MGLFSFLRSKPVFEEYVYFTDAAKRAGLPDQVRAIAATGDVPLIAYHYPRTLPVLSSVLDRAGLRYRVVTSYAELEGTDFVSGGNDDVVVFASAILPDLNQRESGRRQMVQGSAHILLYEHYPIAGPDDAVRRLVDTLPVDVALRAVFSIDEPWFKRIDPNGNMPSLFERMGVKEADHVGAMVSKAIINAQKKLSKRVRNDLGGEDAEAWFAKNVVGR